MGSRSRWFAVSAVVICGLGVGCLSAPGAEPAAPATGPAAAKPPAAIIGTLFGQPRSATEDVIYLRSNIVMRGTVLNEQFTISTPSGAFAVPLRRCAGVAFGGPRVNTETLVSVNFNLFTGIVSDRIIRFRAAGDGGEVQLRKDRVRYLLLKRTPGERDFAAADGRTCLFVMANGDFLTGQPTVRELVIANEDDELEEDLETTVRFAELAQIVMPTARDPDTVVIKANQEAVRGRLTAAELTVRLDLGLTAEAIGTDRLTKIIVGDGNAQAIALALFAAPISDEPEPPPPPATAAGDEVALTIPGKDKVQLRMRRIPAGTFLMGSPVGEGNVNESPMHEVTISRPFYLGVFEVTQAQWQALMPPRFAKEGEPLEQAEWPVQRVSWDLCQRFVERLNKLGLGTFRLPTEAEWEYACRAGTRTRYYWGPVTRIEDYAWYAANANGAPQRVGQKKPNAWGLYDMCGNVWEWCQDAAGSYSEAAQTDPGTFEASALCPMRGGGWGSTPAACCSPARGTSFPSERSEHVGLRLLLEIPVGDPPRSVWAIDAGHLEPDELVLTIPGPGKVQMRMRPIRARTFTMGGPMGEGDKDESPLREVTISRSFHLGTFEISQAQWQAVMGTNPSYFGKAPDQADRPVENVSWEDCQGFLKKLSSLGLGTFRLPTEAEWEFACREGMGGAFYWGDPPQIGAYAWYADNADQQTQPIGLKKPNEWGLYDMSGNVAEWCQDWYAYYPGFKQRDPSAPVAVGGPVVRGGSWNSDAAACRSAARDWCWPSVRRNYVGLRVVRVAE